MKQNNESTNKSVENKIIEEFLQILKENQVNGASVKKILRAVSYRFSTEARL